MLVRCNILRLFVNTLTDDYKYSVLNRDNLTQHIFQKKMTFIADVFPKLPSPEKAIK